MGPVWGGLTKHLVKLCGQGTQLLSSLRKIPRIDLNKLEERTGALPSSLNGIPKSWCPGSDSESCWLYVLQGICNLLEPQFPHL